MSVTIQLIPIPATAPPALADGVVVPEIAHEVCRATRDLYGRVGCVPPFTGYLAIESERCVGTCGYAAPPREGVVEIAYFTFPEYEGQGVATRMAASLIAIAQRADPGLRIIAHTLAERNASQRILEKLGFRDVGLIDHPEDGTVRLWRLEG